MGTKWGVWIRIGGHKNDCFGVKNMNDGWWAKAWSMPEMKYLSRDRLGRPRKSTSQQFLVFECNDSDCPAKMAVHYDDVERILGVPDA